MPRLSGCRAAVEPLAALAAVFAVAMGLFLYAGVYADQPIDTPEPATASTEWTRVHAGLRVGGLLRPTELRRLPQPPAGWHRRVTIRVGTRTWQRGPVPPSSALVHSRPVPVRIDPSTVRSGRLRVVLWIP